MAASAPGDAGVCIVEQPADAKLRASAEPAVALDAQPPSSGPQKSSSPLDVAAVEVSAAIAVDVTGAGKKRKLDEMHTSDEPSGSETAVLTGSGGTLESGDASSSNDESCCSFEGQHKQELARSASEEESEEEGEATTVRLSPEAHTSAEAEDEDDVEDEDEDNALDVLERKAARRAPAREANGKDRAGHGCEGNASVAAEAQVCQPPEAEKGETKKQEVDTPVEREKSRTVGRFHRRRKRGKASTASKGISAASAQMLFQCSCQLLRSQSLDYQVRAREMAQRTTAQALEVADWEKKIRSLKRELNEYDDEAQQWASGAAFSSATLAVTGVAGSEPKRPAGRTSFNVASAVTIATTRTTTTKSEATMGSLGSTDPSLPLTVATAEAALHEELQHRTQKLDEYWRSVPGFTDAVDDGPTQLM